MSFLQWAEEERKCDTSQGCETVLWDTKQVVSAFLCSKYILPVHLMVSPLLNDIVLS